MFENMNVFYSLFGAVGFVAFTFLIALLYRRVVPTNEVHIVQYTKHTTSYG